MDRSKILRGTTSATALAFAATASLALASSAHAALVLSADISGVAFTCADQAACDSNPEIGELGFGSVATPLLVNGVEIFGSLQIAEDTSGIDTLSSSSLQVINTSGAARTIQVAVGATGFSGSALATFGSTGAGTFRDTPGSTMTMNYFIDPANGQGGEDPNDTPGVLIDTFTSAPAGIFPFGFSHNDTGGATTSASYSMTLQFTFTLDGDGRLTSRGQVLQVDSPVLIDVPEPVSLALFGMGLLGLGAVARARRQG